MAAHIGDSIKKKIIQGEYVDFSKLCPKNRREKFEEEECGMQVVNKWGYMYCVPSADRQDGVNVINSYQKWEQAFRVFAHIYTSKFPQKASELMQYSHVIHSSSMSYPWENVYAYDHDFCYHIGENPGRSWAVTLQQAWNLCMRTGGYFPGGAARKQVEKGNKGKRDVCWKFNTGKCTYGLGCKFEHKCALCGKYGHGSHNCRRAHGTEHGGNDREHRDWGQSPRRQEKPEKSECNDRFHFTKPREPKEDK